MLDLSWITESIAVGGPVADDCVEELRGHGITAVVDLRDESRDDDILLRRHGIAFLHLPTADLEAVSAEMLRAGVAFASATLGRGERVLLHCQHGIGRSALLALCVLVEQGHPPLAALELAKSRRAKVSPSPAQFEAWAAWLRTSQHRCPTFDEFAAIAYRQLGRP